MLVRISIKHILNHAATVYYYRYNGNGKTESLWPAVIANFSFIYSKVAYRGSLCYSQVNYLLLHCSLLIGFPKAYPIDILKPSVNTS